MPVLESLSLYEVLTKHFRNDKDAKIAVEAVENISENKINTIEEKLLNKDDKIDLIDRIYKAKIHTIVWIVGVGIVQLVLIFLSKALF